MNEPKSFHTTDTWCGYVDEVSSVLWKISRHSLYLTPPSHKPWLFITDYDQVKSIINRRTFKKRKCTNMKKHKAHATDPILCAV